MGGGGQLYGSPIDTVDSADSGAMEELSPLQEACATGEDGSADTLPLHSLESSVTWTLDFDEQAEAKGFFDCWTGRPRATIAA